MSRAKAASPWRRRARDTPSHGSQRKARSTPRRRRWRAPNSIDMRPIDAARRPETLHLCAALRSARARGPGAARRDGDPRIHATIDHGGRTRRAAACAPLSREFSRSRRAASRGDGRRARHGRRARRCRLIRLSRPARRRDRFHPRAALAGLDAEAVHLCARLRARRAQADRSLDDVPEGASGVNNADGRFSGRCCRARRSPIRAMCRRPICCAASGSRRTFNFCTISACMISRRRRRVLRHLDGDRRAADAARASDARLWRARRGWRALRSCLSRAKSSDGAARAACCRATRRGSSPRCSPIRWRACRAFRATARSNILSRSR